MPENKCNKTEEDDVPEELWKAHLQAVRLLLTRRSSNLQFEGSLMLASILLILLGATGLVGKIAKCVGPITICPLVILLTLGTVDTIEQKLALHWVAIM